MPLELRGIPIVKLTILPTDSTMIAGAASSPVHCENLGKTGTKLIRVLARFAFARAALRATHPTTILTHPNRLTAQEGTAIKAHRRTFRTTVLHAVNTRHDPAATLRLGFGHELRHPEFKIKRFGPPNLLSTFPQEFCDLQFKVIRVRRKFLYQSRIDGVALIQGGSLTCDVAALTVARSLAGAEPEFPCDVG